MSLPRWTVYPALFVIAIILVVALPKRSGGDPHAGAAGEALAEAARPDAGAPQRTTKHPQVMVLGIDGMDPDILAEVIAERPERFPNFRWLIAQQDGIQVLGTSCPPISPVAWSNFITGLDPGGHGIFDFIHRDPTTRGLAPATSVTEEGSYIGIPGQWRIPIGGGSASNRTGGSFWETLADHGVPADIWRMPVNFPVEKSDGVSFPGMMTPALDSAYGECSFYTSDPLRKVDLNRDDSKKVFLVNPRDGVVYGTIKGPANPFKDPVPIPPDNKHHADVVEEIGFTAVIDHESQAAAIQIEGGETVILQPGEWSDFVQLEFGLLPGGTMTLHGIARFYLRSIEPEFELYISPVNLDPENPPTPVSEPPEASAELAAKIGRYYTQGMAEDVNALKKKILTDAEFMQQANLVYIERRRMMDYALDRYLADDDGGLLFFYFSSVDLICHMMWRHTDPAHPFHDAKLAAEDSSFWSGREGSTWKDLLKDLYVKMDPVLGRIRERLGDDVTMIVMSDHGFAPFRRKFNLNTWLLNEGYLVLKEDRAKEYAVGNGKEGPFFMIGTGIVDWSKTRAYGMGFNGLYLNRKGRELDNKKTDEDESGIVEKGPAADDLLAEIKAKLEGLVDNKTGLRPIVRCDLAREVYHGGRLEEAPDILVGYNAGYGNSDESALGTIRYEVLEDNDVSGTFNGSHLMVPDVVHGILISNRKVREGFHQLQDLTVEVLAQYGIERPPAMTGHRVLE